MREAIVIWSAPGVAEGQPVLAIDPLELDEREPVIPRDLATVLVHQRGWKVVWSDTREAVAVAGVGS